MKKVSLFNLYHLGLVVKMKFTSSIFFCFSFLILINQNCFSQNNISNSKLENQGFPVKVVYCMTVFRDIENSFYFPTYVKILDSNPNMLSDITWLRRTNAINWWHARKALYYNRYYKNSSEANQQLILNQGVDLYLSERKRNTDNSFTNFLTSTATACEKFVQNSVGLDAYYKFDDNDWLNEALKNGLK